MIERWRDIKILYRKYEEYRWCSSLPLLGVIRFTPRIVAHVHGTIFLHGLNISHDYLNFHSPWSMVFRYERLASSFRNDTLFLQETSLFSVPINYALLNSSYRVTRFVFIRIILSKIFSLSIQDRERLADKIRNREFWNNFIATFPSILELLQVNSWLSDSKRKRKPNISPLVKIDSRIWNDDPASSRIV